jgi:hypothetical protein
MATSKSAQYWLRVAGNDNNGGGFDSGISGAGTNYADQDAAQLALTGLTCTVNGTTLTQTGGTFTSTMVGNAIQITGGTNFLKDIYWITAFTNSNNVVLDRTPATAGAGSAGTGNLGGALATLKCLSTGGSAAANPLNTTTQLVAGNTINIRGSGTNDPSSFDYDFSAGYWTFPNGDTTNGPIRFFGYNGRPYIRFSGLLMYNCANIIHNFIKYVCTVATFSTYGAVYVNQSAYNCIFDQNNLDVQMASLAVTGASFASLINCEFRSTGGGSGGTNPMVSMSNNYFALVYQCWIHTSKGAGIKLDGPGSVIDTIINGNGSDGILLSSGASFGTVLQGNTIYNNAGNGINITSAFSSAINSIQNNLITDHTVASKYGINFTGGTADTNAVAVPGVIDFNAFYNNTNGNYNGITTNIWPTFVGTNDVSLTGSPYTNAAGNDFSLNNTASAGAAARNIAEKVGTRT